MTAETTTSRTSRSSTTLTAIATTPVTGDPAAPPTTWTSSVPAATATRPSGTIATMLFASGPPPWPGHCTQGTAASSRNTTGVGSTAQADGAPSSRRATATAVPATLMATSAPAPARPRVHDRALLIATDGSTAQVTSRPIMGGSMTRVNVGGSAAAS